MDYIYIALFYTAYAEPKPHIHPFAHQWMHLQCKAPNPSTGGKQEFSVLLKDTSACELHTGIETTTSQLWDGFSTNRAEPQWPDKRT